MSEDRKPVGQPVEYTIDGIVYTIFPTTSSSGYHASWQCACGQTGSSSRVHGSPEDAISRAEQHLLTHHGIAHGKDARS